MATPISPLSGHTTTVASNFEHFKNPESYVRNLYIECLKEGTTFQHRSFANGASNTIAMLLKELQTYKKNALKTLKKHQIPTYVFNKMWCLTDEPTAAECKEWISLFDDDTPLEKQIEKIGFMSNAVVYRIDDGPMMLVVMLMPTLPLIQKYIK
jgi:hypothetical protein